MVCHSLGAERGGALPKDREPGRGGWTNASILKHTHTQLTMPKGRLRNVYIHKIQSSLLMIVKDKAMALDMDMVPSVVRIGLL